MSVDLPYAVHRIPKSAILLAWGQSKNASRENPHLIATVRKHLPDFAKACADEAEVVLLHQDSFAADYQDDEYMLLGMAIKYAGLRGKEVRVIGKNRQTLGEEDTIQ